MAINYNINPYQVGAVVVDNRPYLQFMQQQMAQRQAKEATLDNYFRDLGKNVTPTGMRSQDVEGLTKKTNEWREFYAKNRDAIVNPKLDNGKAYTEYMGRYQDQLAHINTSKNELKIDEEFGKIKLDPNKSFILDDPTIIEKFQKHTLPLGDPNRQSLNLAEISTPPKPWDIKDREAYSKYLTTGLAFDELPGKTENLPGFKTRTPIIKQYSDENLRVIGQRAMGAYDSDRALQFQTNKLTKDVMNDPALHNQLNSVYKRVYGKDAETPKELLAAQAILDENRKSTEYKEGKDDYGMQLAMENIRFGHQKQLKKEEQKIANDWVINYWDERIRNAKSGQPTPLPDPNNPLTIKMGYEIEPDGVMLKGLSRSGIDPDAVFVTTDNKIVPTFYVKEPYFDEKGKKLGTEIITDESGNPLINKDLSKPMSMDQAYLSTGYRGQTKKDLGGTMSGTYGAGQKTGKYPLPAGKPSTVKQGGHIYTWNSQTGNYE